MSHKLSTSSVGRHSELLAMAALIANGWSVSEPTVPMAYDLLAEKDNVKIKIQVKTIKQREQCGDAYYVIRGIKNNKRIYTTAECDAFIGVIDSEVYMTPCRNISEYWVRKDEAEVKWERISLSIK